MISDKEFTEKCSEYEKNLNEEFKKDFGIFNTDINLASDIIDFLNIPTSAICIDPTCGIGSFIKSMKDHGIENIYGCDTESQAIKHCRSITNVSNIFNIDTISIEGKDVLSLMSQQPFDYIVGNPPYVPNVKNISLNDKHPFVKLVKESGNNLFIASIYRMFELAKPNGVISIIIPKNILHISSYKKIREVLLKEKTILSIIELGIYFKKVRGEQIVLTILNKPSRSNTIKYYVYENRTIKYISEAFQSTYDDKIIVFANNEDIPIYQKFKSLKPTLGSICIEPIRRGRSKEENAIKGKDIRKFGFKDASLPISGTQVFIQNIFSAESGLIASFGGSLNAYETVTIINCNDVKMAKLVLGLLLSRLCNFFLIRYIFNNARLTIHTDGPYLKDIPMIIESSKKSAIIKVVKELESADYMSEMWYDANERLNDLVYKAYGINSSDKEHIEREMKLISSTKWYNH